MFIDQLIPRLLDTNGNFFAVKFLCRCPRIQNGVEVAPVGRQRNMLCSLPRQQFILGVIPPHVRLAEDQRCGVFTVFCVDSFAQNRQNHPNWTLFQQGSKAHRRINLLEIEPASLIINDVAVEDCPPHLRPMMHLVSNPWQVDRLAQMGIAPNGTEL